MTNEKNQNAEETLETSQTIAPADAEATTSELSKEEAEKAAGGGFTFGRA